MPGIPGSIVGELGELGKQIGTEVAKAPTDIVGKALESLGTSSGKKKPGNTPTANAQPNQEGNTPKGPWESFDSMPDKNSKQAVARAALEDLLGRNKSKSKEPTVWERLQQEEAKKKQMEMEKAKASQMAELPKTPSKAPRGNLYGTAKKQKGSETSRNVRSD